MNTNKIAARTFGIAFLIGYISYGLGFGLSNSIFNLPDRAYGYLSSAIASTVLLIVGAIFLLLLVPISEEFIKAGSIVNPNLDLLSLLCKKANFYSY